MVEWLLIVIALYGVAGVCFAVAFVVSGVARIDARAAGSGVGFRLLILPGAAALWPVLAVRWARAGRGGRCA